MIENENLAVVSERWPWFAERLQSAPAPADAALLSDLPAQPIRIDGVQLAGGHDPRTEALLQASLVPESAPEATVYGLGEGWLARTLLARPGLTRLRLCPMSAVVARVVLENLPLMDVLSDPRVELIDCAGEGDLQLPFAVAPAELVLAETAAARLRDLLVLELSTPFLSRRRDARADEIRARIASNRSLVERDGDVGQLAGRWDGRRVHVVGAGPSLEDSLVLLHAREAGEPILACDGALRSLVSAGLQPDHVLAMDLDREALVGLLDVPAEVSRRITLIYDPAAHRDALEGWAGPRLVTYGSHEAYAEIAAEQPRTPLWSAGSVLHAVVDLAVLGGADEIVLHGADFATPGGKSHADGFAWQKDLPDRGPHGAWVEGQGGERLRSLPNLLGYLRELERYIERTPHVRFFNASGGAQVAGTDPLEVRA